MIPNSRKTSLHQLFPTLHFSKIAIPDMSVGSNFFGNDPQHEDLELATKRLGKFQQENPGALLANGYLEERSFYNTPRFERTVNGITEYRNIHLGTDFWVPAQTPVHAVLDGEVVISHHNDFHKDYGPLLVVKHTNTTEIFYTLYGHLTLESLKTSPKGKKVKKGELLGNIGSEEENGHWVPHLHFQIITDLMNETENYNGVAFPSELERWEKLCPNPNLLFEEVF
tara:strand:- start:56940 stop:57617 length:678 start_codon:yes stop_codon:yes gene_type:complete